MIRVVRSARWYLLRVLRATTIPTATFVGDCCVLDSRMSDDDRGHQPVCSSGHGLQLADVILL